MMTSPNKPKPHTPPAEQPGTRFPHPESTAELPAAYPQLLDVLKARIRQERLRVVMAANAAMVLLYWDIGRTILDRQEQEGWGAKVIDRLLADLRREFPDMQGLSPRNLKYMRAFAAAWPNRQIVQEVLARITWYHNIALLEKLSDPEARLWITNFPNTLPPADSDMAAQVFKDPYLFDFLGTADPPARARLCLRPVCGNLE